MKYLFIGGIADGAWIEVPKGHVEYKIPHFPDPEWFPPGDERSLDISAYKAMRFRGHEAAMLAIFVLDGMSEQDALIRLISGYQINQQ